jgi:hypothetical protein
MVGALHPTLKPTVDPLGSSSDGALIDLGSLSSLHRSALLCHSESQLRLNEFRPKPLHVRRLHHQGRESALWQTRRYSVITNVQAIEMAKSRELAYRMTSSVEVTLFWRKLDNALTLRLREVATGIEFEFGVRPEDALDAFNHPYAYLPDPNTGSLKLLAA